AALLRPVQRRALRVRVNQGDALALARPNAREVQRQRRLADAALLVEERDDHRRPPGTGVKGSCGRGCVSAASGRCLPATLRAFVACRTRFSTSRARSSRLESLLDSKL